MRVTKEVSKNMKRQRKNIIEVTESEEEEEEETAWIKWNNYEGEMDNLFV